MNEAIFFKLGSENMAKKTQFGIYVPNFGSILGDAVQLANLTKLAEECNWDGFFIWDHILIKRINGPPICNPWIALGLMASQTDRITIGTTITPLPRRNPWELARETVTVDLISNGRLILGVGLGEPPEVEYGSFNKPFDVKTRREKLDESLRILQGLWSGEPFSFQGKHYKLEEVTFLPKAVNNKIPIWVAGQYPRKGPIKRAAKYAGIIPLPEGLTGDLSIQDYKDLHAKITTHRGNSSFDIVMITTVPKGPDAMHELQPYIDIGVNWFLQYLGPNMKLNDLEKRIKQGPPEN